MAKLIFLNTQIGGIETLPAAVGDGRTLGLNPTQFDTLKKNASTQMIEFCSKEQEPVLHGSHESIISDTEVAGSPFNTIVLEASEKSEESAMPDMGQGVGESVGTPINDGIQPVENAAVTSESAVSEFPVVEPIIPEVAPVSAISEIPVVDTATPVIPEIKPSEEETESVETSVNEMVQSESVPVIPEPVIQEEAPSPLPGQIEIVSNTPVNTDYDKLIVQIADINADYDRQIAELNQKRTEEIQKALEENKNKIVDYEVKIKDLQGRAEEHLKNAQAAETIATIAQANAQKNIE